MAPGPRRRRVVERVGRRRGGRARVRRPRDRHGRLDPAARGVLRRRRAQAHLRAREPGRRDAALLVARPRGAARPDGARRRGAAGRDRGGRSRRRHRSPGPSRTTWPGLDRRSPDSGSACRTVTTGRASTPRSRRPSGTAIDGLRGLGAQVAECPLPDPALLNDVANVIARCESAAVHARIVRESPHTLQPAVRARIEIGFHVSAHDYLQATRLRARATRTFVAEVFARGRPRSSRRPSPSPRPPWRRRRRGARRDRPANGPLLAPDAAVERARAAGPQPCPAASRPTGGRSGSSWSDARSTRRRCSGPATPTSRRRAGGGGARRSRSRG